ncbi:hypothetical protein I5C44_04400 [Staphylococcus aureus]|nr:hypothetical protein I5C44_04400 [Staphylococcus aureus]
MSTLGITDSVIASVVPVVFALLNAIKVLTGGVLALGGAVAIAGHHDGLVKRCIDDFSDGSYS